MATVVRAFAGRRLLPCVKSAVAITIDAMSDTQADPLKLLFIRSKHRWRSLTAEQLLDGFNGYAVRSAGTERDARVKVTAGHVGWADLIFEMEK